MCCPECNSEFDSEFIKRIVTKQFYEKLEKFRTEIIEIPIDKDEKSVNCP